MKITEFFNPYNMEHVKAYKHLITHNVWQEGFLPEDIEYDICWQAVIAFKIANVWIEQVLAGNVIGMPPVEFVESCDAEEQAYKNCLLTGHFPS